MSDGLDPRQPRVRRALALFGVASALSWWAFYVPGVVSSALREVQFVGYWAAALLATWWGSSTVGPVLKWLARGACASVVLALAPHLDLLRLLPLHPALLPLAQDGLILTWATLFSAALGVATLRASRFFGRAWFVLIAYRLLLHAATWPEAFGVRLLGEQTPLLTASGQALMLVLVAFSWISLRSPESASAPP